MSNVLTPGPKPVKDLLSQLRLFMAFDKDAAGVIVDGFRRYGDVWQIIIGTQQQFMFQHPDHYHQILITDADKFHKDMNYKDRKKGLARFMGNGLVTSDGEYWRRQRKLLQPAFHTKRIDTYAQIMVESTLKHMAHWRDGALLEVDHAMMETTLEIVVKALFSADASADAARVGAAMTTFQAFSNNKNQLLPSWLPTPLELRTRQAVRDMDEIVFRLIRERRQDSADRGDLLSMLLAAQDEEGKGMTDSQLRDELVTLFLAGHETTANTLNWTFVLLAQHPEVEAKLHHEIDAHLAGRAPTLQDLRQLPYTEMIIKESMRLRPAVFAIGRQAIEDVVIGGHHVPKGASVSLFQLTTHRDPRWWGEDAEQFVPERFSPEREARLKKYAYLPFSTGPRVCIGNSFAMMEAQLMLATIAQRWRLSLQPGQTVQPEPLITLRPKGGLRMRVHARPTHVDVVATPDVQSLLPT